MPDLTRVPTAPLLAAGLVGGFAAAQQTGVRPLGGCRDARRQRGRGPAVVRRRRRAARRRAERRLLDRDGCLAPAGEEGRHLAVGARRHRGGVGCRLVCWRTAARADASAAAAGVSPRAGRRSRTASGGTSRATSSGGASDPSLLAGRQVGGVAVLLGLLEVLVLRVDDVVVASRRGGRGRTVRPAGGRSWSSSALSPPSGRVPRAPFVCRRYAASSRHLIRRGGTSRVDDPLTPRVRAARHGASLRVAPSRRTTCSSTVGSARKVIARTWPSATSKSKTTAASPRRNQADAGRSPTKTAIAAWALPLKKVATSSRPSIGGGRAGQDRGLVGADHRVGREQLQQPLEVAAAGGGHEGVDDLPVGQRVLGRRLRDLGPGARRELAGRDGRGVEDGADGAEVEAEAVVQDEGHPLARRQPVDDRLEGDADRVGQRDVVRGVGHRLGPRSAPRTRGAGPPPARACAPAAGRGRAGW